MSSKSCGPNYYPVPSPSSSPPRVLKRTPAVPSLPPSPPSSSCGLQLPAKSHLQQARDYINSEDFETPRLLLAEFSWDDFDLFLGELSDPQNITPGRAAKLRYYHSHDPLISFLANRTPVVTTTIPKPTLFASTQCPGRSTTRWRTLSPRRSAASRAAAPSPRLKKT